MHRAIFIDKDGTLIKNVTHNVNPELIQLEAEAPRALMQLRAAGYRLYLISNQPGVALGYFAESDLNMVQRQINHLLKPYDLRLDGFYYCPHHPEARIPIYRQKCRCRKPQAGLLLKAAAENQIDLERSWMLGDILDDIEAGNRAGCRTILIDNNNETEWIDGEYRAPHYRVQGLIEASFSIAQEDGLTISNLIARPSL